MVAYEIYVAAPNVRLPVSRRRRLSDATASAEDVADLQRHCLRVMTAVGFMQPEKPKLLDRRLRCLLSRATLVESEVQILRGLLTAVKAHLK